jgi:hypothetical protein
MHLSARNFGASLGMDQASTTPTAAAIAVAAAVSTTKAAFGVWATVGTTTALRSLHPRVRRYVEDTMANLVAIDIDADIDVEPEEVTRGDDANTETVLSVLCCFISSPLSCSSAGPWLIPSRLLDDSQSLACDFLAVKRIKKNLCESCRQIDRRASAAASHTACELAAIGVRRAR